MEANAVLFSVPMPKAYKRLPPLQEEIEEIVAFIFIGSLHLTNKIHRRLSLFMRHNKVRRALKWLKLNDKDYSDLEISYENLEQYPELGLPAVKDYRPDWIDNELENKASYEVEDWSSVEE